MFLLNNTPLSLDVPFKDAEGNSYPANWLRLTSIEEKNAIGIVEVADPIIDVVIEPVEEIVINPIEEINTDAV